MTEPTPLGDLLAAAQLLRLASPTLPIGAFAWSSGLEGAIADHLVHDSTTAERWIHDVIAYGHGRWDAPILWAMLTLPARRADLDALYRASRETQELRAETHQLGASLLRLLTATDPSTLGVRPPHFSLYDRATGRPAPETEGVRPPHFSLSAHPAAPPAPTLPLAWALAAEAWQIPAEAALLGWLVAVLDNQIAVLQKALPLGQTAAQRLHAALLPTLVATHAAARALPEADWSSALPGLALTSARHETQYSRLFRS